MSKRSFEALTADGLEGAGVVLAAKLKPCRSFEDSGERFTCGPGVGLVCVDGFGVGKGLVSKKPPPPSDPEI